MRPCITNQPLRGLSPSASDDRPPATNTCGGCQACCVVYPIPELDKPGHKRCPHQCDQGCALHNQPRVQVCEQFTCSWLDLDLQAALRPDRNGGVILAHGDLVKADSRILLGQTTRTDEPKLWEINFLSKQAFCQPTDVLRRWIFRQAKMGIVVCVYGGPGCGSTPTPALLMKNDIRIYSRLPFTSHDFAKFKREAFGDMLRSIRQVEAKRTSEDASSALEAVIANQGTDQGDEQ